MLEMRSHCECCRKALPPSSVEAMICSFECTFCTSCVTNKLHHVCPNCGGGFQQRPVRPSEKLAKYPPKNNLDIPDFNPEKHAEYLEKYSDISAEKR